MATKIMMIIAGLITLVMSPPLFMFSMVGLAPAMVANTVDRLPGKNTSSSVFYFNLAGVALVSKDVSKHAMQDMAAVLAPMNLFVVYVFAALGWFIVWILPRITVIVTDYKNEKRALGLRDKIEKISEEWGAEARG